MYLFFHVDIQYGISQILLRFQIPVTGNKCTSKKLLAENFRKFVH